MFGYVTPHKMELKIKDYERFKAYYCGLCHHIKDNYGNLSRVCLNYDMTFLGLLLDGLSDEPIEVKKIRCPLHITENRPIIINNKALHYSSSINIALFYYKLQDDIIDDKSIKGKLGSLFFSSKEKKFSSKFKNINDILKKELTTLKNIEDSLSFNSIDEICHPFAHLTGELLKSYPEPLKNDSEDLRTNLYWLGYNLGKWIYLIDAFDDLREDIEKNKFNPINHLFNKENEDVDKFINDITARIEFSLLSCGASCHEAFLKLKPSRNYDILDNILSLGIMEKNHLILNKYSNQCNINKE